MERRNKILTERGMFFTNQKRKVVLLLVSLLCVLNLLAQNDSARTAQSDTIRVGGMIIIKKPGGGEDRGVTIHKRHQNYNPSNLTTNWFQFDLGFSNWTDNTDYAAATSSGFLATGVGKDELDLRSGKSINVDIWIFIQKLNLVKHVVNLKYGFGLELNNYRFSSDIKFQKNPTKIIMDNVSHNKNKLAADYATIPMMLNFDFTPHREKGFGLSFGASAGYLYSARQKFKGGEGGKYKTHDDFDLRKFKIAYIGELQLGPVKFYGSVATKSMWEKGLDMTPYNVGFRFGDM